MIRLTRILTIALLISSPLLQAEDEEPVILDETSVIGDQELPVGLEIVPWQPATPGPAGGTPPQLVGEELEPLDPEIFRRELELYESTR